MTVPTLRNKKQNKDQTSYREKKKKKGKNESII